MKTVVNVITKAGGVVTEVAVFVETFPNAPLAHFLAATLTEVVLFITVAVFVEVELFDIVEAFVIE